MKRNIIFKILVVCMSYLLLTAASAQPAFQKGDFNISAGYGIGNVWKKFLKDNFNSPYPIAYTLTAKGPYCLLVDYSFFRGFLRNVSMGIAAGYSKTHGYAEFRGAVFSEYLTTFSILARANYHFVGLNKLDPYLGGGAGYYHFKYRNENVSNVSKVPGLFGYSLQLGARYYFVPALSIYAEAGYIAGSFGQAGLCLKIR